MANPLSQLLCSIQDGLVLVSPMGKVKFANEAAQRRHGAPVLAEIAASADLKKHIKSVTSGRIKLPASIQVQIKPGMADEQSFGCTLIEAPNQIDYSLLIHQTHSGSAYSAALSSMLEIIDQELGGPIRDLLATAAPADPVLVAGGARALAMQEIVNRVDKLKNLVEVFGAAPLVGSDRVVLKDLVMRAWARVAPLASARKAQASLVGFHDDLAPVYGSADWLERALCECLENAVRHSITADSSGAGPHIEIRANPLGGHVGLVVRNLGAGTLAKHGDRVFLPFNRAGLPRSTGAQGMSIGLPLCKRIIELHGGHMRINTGEDDSVSIAIELPTGAPKRETGEQALVQAQMYAQDLAKLMGRQKRAARQPSTSVK